ncbi:MAG: AAA family ATPase, partial [Nanoarchaeota archaeon]|nr:AAA family ATPase [Nanoarchaeota archaeon]
MSYIKRLKLKGFKSFSNPTVLSFETGFNTIVGANGSGKSNVFDALCFVLGRMSSKGLRADKLGNLVFNGGKNLKPSKEAEVSIYLSNTNKELMDNDLQEIKISRVVKNTGQSQYLLNNQKVTRTEIVEVLRNGQIDPDGYNIILQGDIMRIVNMTPVERRELIEEISDISGYEDQRQKSLKKLDKVEEGLKEADLLMEEKTKYLKELKAEKEQAQKYSKVKDSLRFNSLLLIKSKIIRNKQIKDKKEEDLKSNEEELSKYKEKLNEFETKSKAIEEEISKIEKEIEIKSHNDFISVTNTITAMESQLSNLKEKRAENKKNIEE